jgi:hypothetical protein
VDVACGRSRSSRAGPVGQQVVTRYKHKHVRVALAQVALAWLASFPALTASSAT